MENFIIQPSIKVFPGVTVKKDTVIDFKNDVVEQHLKDLVLTTKINKKSDYNGLKTSEKSTIKTQLKEGVQLVMSEEEGYVISPYKMTTIDDAIEQLKELKEIYSKED
jgi:hypothetical protein